MAASAVLVGIVMLGTSSSADAHAVLLRTDPSPQSTVPRSPSAIHLEYSEPVEAAFGAVRLFDVDGRRVDAGTLRRADANRALVLPVPPLDDGTYMVTWRVASPDGHAVSGGFEFYVGAPSAISAVAVEPEQGTGAVVRWGYGAVRFAWFGGLIALLGLVAARRWVWTPAVRAAQLERSETAAIFRRGFRVALPAAWLVLAVSGVLWVVFQGATLSGLSLFSSLRPSVLGEVFRSSFGRVWAVGLVLTLLAAAPVLALVRRRPLLGVGPRAWIALLGALAAGICVSSALSGHARTDPTPVLAVPSVALHLLVVGVWVGGLGTLVGLGGRAWRSLPSERRPELLRQLVPRFSRLAVVAVALVITTGVVNSLANLGPLSDLWRVPYGRVLSGKVLLLAVALLLAARHLWIVPRRLAVAAGGQGTVASFQRSATAELLVLGGALGLATALVALVPGRTLAEAARGPVDQERRAGPYTVQLFLDPTVVGANQLHLTFVDAQGLGAGEVANVAVTLAPSRAAARPVAMRLIAPGHFVADVDLPTPGGYDLSVSAPSIPDDPSATFRFRVDDDREQ